MTRFTNPARRMLAAFSGLADRMRDKSARARSRRAIADLDEATLRDIGVSRAEAMSIAFGGDVDRRRTHG